MEKLKGIAQCIVDYLDGCGFDDVTDSSGYYVIKEFMDGTDRAFDVYKSTADGMESPHYVVYCLYEDDCSDYRYTADLSVESLLKVLEDLYIE